jgi:hypothetical protein
MVRMKRVAASAASEERAALSERARSAVRAVPTSSKRPAATTTSMRVKPFLIVLPPP